MLKGQHVGVTTAGLTGFKSKAADAGVVINKAPTAVLSIKNSGVGCPTAGPRHRGIVGSLRRRVCDSGSGYISEYKWLLRTGDAREQRT